MTIFEESKRKDLKKLASDATNELKTCDNTKKKWCEFIIDIFSSTKAMKTDKKCLKQTKRLEISSFLRDFGVFS